MTPKWRRKEYGLAFLGITIISMMIIMKANERNREKLMDTWPGISHYDPATCNSSTLADLIILEDATKNGAVCLDGTPPGYHLQRGFGTGSNNWLIHLEGGGWCNNSTCQFRKRSHLGSSLYMEKQIQFSGILSNKPSENPDFFNWNRVKVRYCDGASFAGDMDVEKKDNIYFRGQHIWKEVTKDLLAKGMNKAHQALLSGCSAGALAAFIHCDSFRDLFPRDVKVKCLGDAGFFLDTQDISGRDRIRSFYNEVITIQGVWKHLPVSCKSKFDQTMCFFPQYLLSYINTPFFVLNPAYDSWQVQNILAPVVADPQGDWHVCKQNIKFCSQTHLKSLQEFRDKIIRSLDAHKRSKSTGMFINSCYVHCQTEMTATWFSRDSPRLNNKTIAEAVGDWFFDRSTIHYIDCPYPCDSSCYHLTYE